MRSVSLRFTLLVLISSLYVSQAAAASTFKIEMVVFQRGSTGGEFSREDRGGPSSSSAIATLTGSQGSPVSIGQGITVLPSNQLSLKAEAEALRRKGMTPLFHAAWRQSVRGRNNSDWLWVNAGPVRGLVRVSLGRYLHFDTNLVYRGSNATLQSKEHRRLRSRELHYIDHPSFGILLEMTPL